MTDADDAIRDQATSHIESLLCELYEPEGVQIWMTSPHRWFGGRRAVDLIAEGRAEEVLAAINRLNDGAWA
ncbi:MULTISPECIES: MbcA/ParS/Xre antitoxin family protein [unclassified Mycobacterium]|uniref:MbcA/ParS/Xre antitoxin family protein n=1 Tax=unclassified Mycobacterium TaxID=2642494 RepID=UPI0009E9E03C